MIIANITPCHHLISWHELHAQFSGAVTDWNDKWARHAIRSRAGKEEGSAAAWRGASFINSCNLGFLLSRIRRRFGRSKCGSLFCSLWPLRRPRPGVGGCSRWPLCLCSHSISFCLEASRGPWRDTSTRAFSGCTPSTKYLRYCLPLFFLWNVCYLKYLQASCRRCHVCNKNQDRKFRDCNYKEQSEWLCRRRLDRYFDRYCRLTALKDCDIFLSNYCVRQCSACAKEGRFLRMDRTSNNLAVDILYLWSCLIV